MVPVINICIADSDRVTETDIDTDGDDGDCGDASFFPSNPVAKDLDLDGSEGMLPVNDMLSGADCVTLIFIMSRSGILKLTFILQVNQSISLPSHQLCDLPGAEPPKH